MHVAGVAEDDGGGRRSFQAAVGKDQGRPHTMYVLDDKHIQSVVYKLVARANDYPPRLPDELPREAAPPSLYHSRGAAIERSPEYIPHHGAWRC